MNKKNNFLNLILVFISISIPIIAFELFDYFYSVGTPEVKPFKLREPKSNGNSLTIDDPNGWYSLGPNYDGESRYGKIYFKVKTDKNGFRVNHKLGEININDYSLKDKRAIFLGDSFTYGVGLDWEDTYIGILESKFNYKSINGGTSSHSPTPYKYKLKQLIKSGAINSQKKVVIALDISDVFDEATRWTTYKGKPANINKLKELGINSDPKNESLTKNSEIKLNKSHKKPFYSEDNFKLTHQIYYGIEGFVKNYIDNIQVRNNIRSKFTHKEWSEIDNRYSPLGVENGLNKIKQGIIEISKLTNANGNELYILIYPWPAQLAYEQSFNWEEFVEQSCIEVKCSGVINSFPSFFSYKKENKSWQKDLYIKGDMHFNRKGNEILANTIASELEI